jgi:hypothetical protein
MIETARIEPNYGVCFDGSQDIHPQWLVFDIIPAPFVSAAYVSSSHGAFGTIHGNPRTSFAVWV